MTQVFISFKNSHQGQPTRDRAMAESLYNQLKNNGIDVFFSNNTLAEKGVSEYKKAIDEALADAQVLVLIGTNKDYITSEWVQYEWDTFMQEILSGRKNGKIFTYLDCLSTSDLPISLRNKQSFSIRTNLESIVKHIKNSLDNGSSKEVPKKELSDGIFAYYGINQEIDYEKAHDILLTFKDDDMALYLLGQIYYYGGILKKDLTKAVDCYVKSMEKGNIMAGYKLAECYKRGLGVEINFTKHNEIKTKLAMDYTERIKTLNKIGFEYVNNLVYIGKTNKNDITKEAILALEIQRILEMLSIDVELFDVDIDNEEKVARVDEIHNERNMFIFSTLRNVNDSCMEKIWKRMFVNSEFSVKTAITYISEIQVRDIPSALRRIPFIIRDAESMSKIVNFFKESKLDG
jgi:TPR repeat protein